MLAIHGTACQVLDAAHIYFTPSFGEDTGRWTFIQAQALARASVDEGFALALAGDLDEALRVWSRVVPSAYVRYEAALAANYIGIVHDLAGRFELAIPAYTEAFDLGFSAPQLQVEACTNCGAARYHRRQIDLAIEDFSRAIGIWESHPPSVLVDAVARALIYRGFTHERNGDSLRAQEDFNRALALRDVPPECRPLIVRAPGVDTG